MDFDTVLRHLLIDFQSIPAYELVWSCQAPFISQDALPRILPSHYNREMNLSSEERHNLLLEQHKVLKFRDPCYVVQADPSIITFQNYKEGQKLKASLSIRNISPHTQKVSFNIDPTDGFYFSEKSFKKFKVAPGMSCSISLCFSPLNSKDYYHKIVVHVNDIKIPIPVIAIGPRGILDIPDKIAFGSAGVNNMSTIQVPVLNIGRKTAKFSLSTTGPFCVSPERGIVAPNDSMTLLVSFLSEQVAPSSGFLTIKYETGEEISVTLDAEAINLPIQIHPLDIEFPDTYVGMKSRASLTICNNSSTKLKFQWKDCSSPSIYFTSPFLQEAQSSTVVDSPIMDESGDQRRHRLYSRGDSLGINKIILRQSTGGHGDGKNYYGDFPEPLFTDDCFLIEPPAGEVHPFSSVELQVIFSPNRSGILVSEAYFDTNGLEQRPELRMSGRALGAKFRFGFDELDLSSVFLGSIHSYDIPVVNTSEVEGTLCYEGAVGLMDGSFSMEPKQLKLAPGEYSAFFLIFKPASSPGPIFEELRFKVLATSEILTLTIKGFLNYPKLTFSESVLDFHDVSYGFSETAQTVLRNDSMIKVEVYLEVEDDGDEMVLSAENIKTSLDDPHFIFPTNPKQFEISPSSFEIPPHGIQRIYVTITPACYGKYNRVLNVLTSKEFGSGVMTSLPIEANCQAPVFILPHSPIEVNCYIPFPSPFKFQIVNPSSLSAVYCCLPMDKNKVLITSKNFVGIITARETVEIELEVISLHRGHSEGTIQFFTVGNPEPIFHLVVNCHGISPLKALSLSTKFIDMGEKKVLVKASKEFEVINSSLVPFPFTTTMVKGGEMREVWEIEPNKGFLAPTKERGTNMMSVGVILKEIGLYNAILRLKIEQTKEHIDLAITVTGFGCGFEIDPELENGEIDFGYIFIKTPYPHNLSLKNPGYISKVVEWKFEGEEPPVNPGILAARSSLTSKSDKKAQKIKPKSKKNPFEAHPIKKTIRTNEKASFIIKAQSAVPDKYEKSINLWTYAEVSKKNVADKDFQKKFTSYFLSKKGELDPAYRVYLPTIAQNIKLKAEFDVPKLRFSAYQLNFRIDPNPNDYTEIYKQDLSISTMNPCKLPLTVILHASPPFAILVGTSHHHTLEQEYKITLEPHEKKHLIINFDVSKLPKEAGITNFSGSLDCIYEQYPSSDEKIQLTGAVHFPTVELDHNIIDFGEVFNGQEVVRELIAFNPGKYCIHYNLFLIPESISVKIDDKKSSLPDTPSLNLTDFSKQSSTAPIRGSSSKKDKVIKVESSEKLSRYASCVNLNSSPRGEQFETDFMTLSEPSKFFYEKFYRSAFMSFLGIKDPDYESNNEFTYFQYFPVEIERNPAPLNEIIDIIPTSGLLQAGNFQKFTLVFYAQSNIHFETKVSINIENGAPVIFTVKGKSIEMKSPGVPPTNETDYHCEED